MESRNRLHAAASTDAGIWRDSDPNYPGVPQPSEVLARSTSRAAVTYETYVLAYGARQRSNLLLAGAGGLLLILGLAYLTDLWLVVVVAIGAIGVVAGLGSLWITADAHASYTQDLAVSMTETYERPNPAPTRQETVRPFIASRNPGTINVGRFDFKPAVYRDLFDLALQNGGIITRDGVAKPAGVGRKWYHGTGWDEFKEELDRLGFIDAQKRLTPAALQWYANTIPLPLSSIPVRSRTERTNGERTGR